MSKNRKTINSTVRVACEVSFTASDTNYGTINVPVGTPVEQIIDIRKSHITGQTLESKSGWFVKFPNTVCPPRYTINGEPGHMFLHDAKYSGIRVPDANVNKPV